MIWMITMIMILMMMTITPSHHHGHKRLIMIWMITMIMVMDTKFTFMVLVMMRMTIIRFDTFKVIVSLSPLKKKDQNLKIVSSFHI